MEVGGEVDKKTGTGQVGGVLYLLAGQSGGDL